MSRVRDNGRSRASKNVSRLCNGLNRDFARKIRLTWLLATEKPMPRWEPVLCAPVRRPLVAAASCKSRPIPVQSGSSPFAAPVPLTWPLFISLSLSLSLIFTDAFFLSRISDDAAGAAGAINPLLSATVVLFTAIGQAGASVAGRLLGAPRMRAAADVPGAAVLQLARRHSGQRAALRSASVFAGLLGLRGQSEVYGQTYLGVLGGFQFLKAIQLAYGNMLNSRGQTRWVMIESVATNVSNIALNVAMAAGIAGLPRPSVGAVAGATVLSLGFGMLFTIGVAHLKLGVRFPRETSWRELRSALSPILRIGLPSASEPISYQCAQVVINLMVISYGASALAARTYVSSFISVTTILWSVALGIGTQIVISHRVGAGKFEEANRELHRALGFAIAGNLTVALCLALFHRELLALLTHDPDVLRQAAPLFGVAILVEGGAP